MNLPAFVLAFAGIEVVMWLAVRKTRWPSIGSGGHFAALVVAALIAIAWAQSEQAV
jgi:hypothetical protein